ncbi:hypothetical protein BO71DRAFT_131479 [Aspergillus ellipticus CBS 707.79]|uniref:Uncharacterized protein n=1 Tax=Aspergillus ellipticus CBS 707.79 TaxID=1448320 RepID=A0A319DKR1_9EURO|nr:hypothetical protein BO71DRAFT_131479 [Aspergillus ellipticus CBS 707.79]
MLIVIPCNCCRLFGEQPSQRLLHHVRTHHVVGGPNPAHHRQAPPLGQSWLGLAAPHPRPRSGAPTHPSGPCLLEPAPPALSQVSVSIRYGAPASARRCLSKPPRVPGPGPVACHWLAAPNLVPPNRKPIEGD